MLRDPFTIVVSIWTCLQLLWVSMLMAVQLLQIARAKTTYETMHSNMHESTHAAAAITSAVMAGSTSMDGAQLNTTGRGPNPTILGAHRPHGKKEGCFFQWKKLLGLDTFVAAATGGDGRLRKRGNPFSRGIVTNCKDFWCDPAPIFRKRENGVAMLDGQVVNYSQMYEMPPKMKVRRPRQDGNGGTYHSVGTEDAV